MILVSVCAGRECLVALRGLIGSVCDDPLEDEAKLADCFSRSSDMARVWPEATGELANVGALPVLTHLSNHTAENEMLNVEA